MRQSFIEEEGGREIDKLLEIAYVAPPKLEE
jgi:hypothetical protein